MAYNPYGNSSAYNPTLVYTPTTTKPSTPKVSTYVPKAVDNTASMLKTQSTKKYTSEKPIKKELTAKEKFSKWFNTNKAGWGELFKKTTFEEASKYNIPGSPSYKEVDLNNEKKYLQNLYSTGNKGQREFAKTQSAIYGLTLSEPESNIAANNPTMAGIFANYQKQSGFKPLKEPIDVNPKSKQIKSNITTPGLGDSEVLINAQKGIKVEPTTVKSDVEITTDVNQGIAEDKPAEDVVDKISNNKKQIDENESNKLIEVLNNQEQTELSNATTPEQKNNIMQYFNKLQNEITRRTITKLKTSREQALLSLGQQQAALTPQYEALRSQAATQSMQQARNFGEYLAARGQSTSGLAAQAELSRGTGLTRQLGQIGQQQQSAQDQLNAKKAQIQSDFQLAIANAKSDAEIAKLNEAFRQAVKQEDRAYAEQLYEKQKQDRLDEIRSSREWQIAFTNYQNAMNQQNEKEANKFKIKMFNLENEATKDLISFKASFEPPATSTSTTQEAYNYVNDPDFADVYNQITSGQIFEYVSKQDVGLPEKRRLVTKTPQEIYDMIVKDRISLTQAFGEDAYKVLLDTAKGKLPKQQYTDQFGNQIITQ